MERAQPGRRHRGLGLAQVGLAEERLAVEVGGLDHVVVDHQQPADTARRQRQQGRTAEATRADHQRALVREVHPGPVIARVPGWGNAEDPCGGTVPGLGA